MKYIKNKVRLATAVILVLSLCLLSVANLVSLVQAAVPWTKDTGELELKDGIVDELFVSDAWVIKDGGTYKMWYTHSKTDMDIDEMADSLTSILSSDILSDLVNLDFDTLLDDLSVIDATTLWNFLNDTSTVIGYATSTDGKVWSVVNDEILAGDVGELESVGTPCVIKNDTNDYEMWFTHSESDLTQPDLQNILTGLAGDTDARKTAMLALLDAKSTAIGYATSTNGEDWDTPPPQFGVLTGPNSGIWDSVANPCIIKNGIDDYDMWFTYAQINLDETGLETILGEIEAGTFTNEDVWAHLDYIQSTIGHANSTDGVGWGTPDYSTFSGGTGLWNSVATPSVINTGSNYEMWYTNFTTDLDLTGFQGLISAMQALEPDISDLLNSYTPGDLTAFLEDLETFLGDPNAEPPIPGDIDPILPYLANTSARIGYATSDDGEAWTEQNPEALTGSSGSPWSSVMSPCVVWEDGVYEIWFTQGVDYPSAQNIVYLMDGSILPIGYATGFNLVAETSAYPDKDTDEIAIVDVKIVQGKDSHTGLQADIPGGVSEFTAIVTGDPLGIEILEVRSIAPFDSLTYNLDDYLNFGTFTISGVATSPIQPSDTTAFKLVTQLIGDATTKYYLTIEFQNIMADDPPDMNVTEENPNTITFLRGDANKDGMVDIADAMYIAQYTVFLRTMDELNALNGASVAHDGTSGDIVDIADAMFIAQYTVFIRDANFELIP